MLVVIYGGVSVKNRLCRMTAIFCMFAIAMVTIAPINTALPNSYLTSVTVTVTTISHSDGSSTSYVSHVDKQYGYHSSQGAHHHESPSVSIEYNFEQCGQCFDVG